MKNRSKEFTELVESFINGNRRHVYNEVMAMQKKTLINFMEYVFLRYSKDDSTFDNLLFMLNSR